jgi:beta-1,4-N-acetylglucosaminyltransferase
VIFLTVGNRYRFDRLVRAVDELVGRGVLAEPVVAQTGEGTYRPQHCEHAPFFDGPTYDRYVREASALVGHAGSGTIASALALGKPLLVMPRRKQFGEHVNDHQVATARRFAALGSVLVAENERELEARLPMLSGFVPHRRIPNVDGLVGRIAQFLETGA